MPTFRYETSQGTFDISSNRPLNQDELMQHLSNNQQGSGVISTNENSTSLHPLEKALSGATGISQGPNLGQRIKQNAVDSAKHTVEVVKGIINDGLFGTPGRINESLKPKGLSTGEKVGTAIMSGEYISGPIVNTALKGIKSAYAIPAIKENKAIENAVGIYKKILKKIPKKITTEGSLKAADEKVGVGLNAIYKNKDIIRYADDTVGRLPQTLEEGVSAASQTRQNLAEQFKHLLKISGDDVVVDMGKIADKIDDSVKGISNTIAAPTAQSYAVKEADRLRKLGNISLDDAEKTIQMYNNKLAPFYNKPMSVVDTTSTKIDANIASMFRKELDDIILSKTGKSYQDIKNAYGAVAEIEKNLVSQVDKIARTAKPSTMQTLDTVPVLYGAFTGNVPLFASGVIQKLIKSKHIIGKNPDTVIKNTFQALKMGGEKTLLQKSIDFTGRMIPRNP